MTLNGYENQAESWSPFGFGATNRPNALRRKLINAAGPRSSPSSRNRVARTFYSVEQRPLFA
jgi:hypothetical protein